MNKKLNKLDKIIDKSYMKNGQHLYITTTCDLPSSSVSIYLSNKKGDWLEWLFDIDTMEMYEEGEYQYKPIINSWINNKYKKSRLNEEISWTPLYSNLEGYSHFVLKKFKPITEEDVFKCLDYFLKEVLKSWLIFNKEIIRSNNE